MATAASSSDQSGAANTVSEVRCVATRSVSGSWPSATETRMSRSVRIPGPSPSGSLTTAAPTPRLAIDVAAWRSVWSGPTVRTTLLIPSRTRIHVPPFDPVACNDWRKVIAAPGR